MKWEEESKRRIEENRSLSLDNGVQNENVKQLPNGYSLFLEEEKQEIRKAYKKNNVDGLKYTKFVSLHWKNLDKVSEKWQWHKNCSFLIFVFLIKTERKRGLWKSC